LFSKSTTDKIKRFAKTTTAAEVINKDREKEALELLSKTKMFFAVSFDRLHKDDINAGLDNGEFWLWVRWGKVSFYYVLLSPLVKEWSERSKLSPTDKVAFEATMYQEGITGEVKTYFEREFKHEFTSKT
jgi:hypothetical protein